MAEKSKAQLAADLAANFADNTDGDITEAVFRGFQADVLDSITASSKVTGSGTDYTLGTGSSALVDFGTQDPEVALPGAGTFLILATVQIQADAGGAGDEVLVKLRQTTGTPADVGIERRVTMPANSALVPVDLVETVTVAAAETIQLWAYNATAARGTVISTKTELKVVRLG